MSERYLFKMQLKGTALKGILNFQKAILTTGIMRWHITDTDIRCSEICPDVRILINYVIDGKSLTEYKYYFPEERHTATFEIQEFSTPISTMKISDILKISITNKEPNIIKLCIVDRDKNTIKKRIPTKIQQEILIYTPPDIYSKMPVNLETDTFHSFMKIANGVVKGGIITIQIQAPNYICFYKNEGESQSHGSIKKKKEVYNATFFISEIKHLLKLLQSTGILGIYQPIESVDVAPLCVKGAIKGIGNFEVYIHRSDVTVPKDD